QAVFGHVSPSQQRVADLVVPVCAAVGISFVFGALLAARQVRAPRADIALSADTVALGDEVLVAWALGGHLDTLRSWSIELEGREDVVVVSKRRRGIDRARSVFVSIPIAQHAAPVPAE